MAGKRVYAKPSRKYRVKRPRFTYQHPSNARTTSVTPSTGIGNRVVSNFVYFDTITLNVPAGGAGQTYIMRINSLFDPDFAFGGHQPAGFDELMAIYEHYCVTDVEYKVCFINSNNNSISQIVSTQVSDNSTSSSDATLMIENGNAQWTVLGIANSGPRTLKGTCDVAKLMGVTRKQLLADDTFWGSQGTNPSDLAFLKVNIGSIPAGVDGADVHIGIQLTFKAVLMGGRFVQQS